MKIMYIASMFDDKELDTVFTDISDLSYAANKYNKLLCEGLAQNQVDVEAIYCLPITRSNCKKICVPPKQYVGKHIVAKYPVTINLPIIRHLFRSLDMFFRVLFLKRDTIVVFDLFALSASIGMNFAAKIRGIKRICILTDLPEHLSSDKNLLRIENNIIADSSGYIFLTEQMNEKVNNFHKPAIVLEGHVDRNAAPADLQKADACVLKSEAQRIVMYAGALHERYGISNLVDAFIRCRKSNEVLHIYGVGDYVEKIIEISKDHPCIQYKGVKPNSEIVKLEVEADLLVNPRTSKGEYTKYSFPSKVLEYMSSGTPVLMAKLPGIPNEYYDYVYTFDSCSDDGLMIALRNVLDKDRYETAVFGMKAQDFVVKNKSNVIQAEKIIKWLRQY